MGFCTAAESCLEFRIAQYCGVGDVYWRNHSSASKKARIWEELFVRFENAEGPEAHTIRSLQAYSAPHYADCSDLHASYSAGVLKRLRFSCNAGDYSAFPLQDRN